MAKIHTASRLFGGITMRPAKIIAAVVITAAVAATGSYLAVSTATHPSAAAQPPATASPVNTAPTGTPQPSSAPDLPPSTTNPSGGQPTPGRCAASALRGSVQDTDGAAGTIYTTIGLRNLSARTCTVKGIPQVRLLNDQDQSQPLTAPSVPAGPAGSLVVVRPGRAAHFTFSRPNACDRIVAGSRLRVTLPQGQGSLIVDLGGDVRFGTCASVGVRALEAATSPAGGRIFDPQVAADRLVAAWVRRDRAAANNLAGLAVTDRLFRESPPTHTPATLPCRLVPDPAVYVCSYSIAQHAELSVFVEGGASAGYSISGIEFGD
jgi:uncharacterized protein DUF4232